MRTMQPAPRRRRPVLALVAATVVVPLIALTSVPARGVSVSRPPGGSYRALTPSRIVDTRTGLGVVAGGPTRRVIVSAAGRAGVPPTGVSAVAVNITATGGSVPGYVTAYSTGSPRPVASSLGFLRRQSVLRMAVVPVDGAGRFTLEASAPAQLAIDVEGYFTTPATATSRGLFNPLDPARLMDSRTRFGAVAPGPGGTSVLQVTGRGGVPANGVSAVVVNTTITGATAGGYVTDYPSGSSRPAAPTVTFAAGQTAANRAIVPVGAGGAISVYNAFGTNQVMIDVVGYFSDGKALKSGGYYVPVAVSRLVDTRFWRTSSLMSTRTVRTQKIAGETCVVSPTTTLCGTVLVPPLTAAGRPTAAILNITAVPKGTSGSLTVYPEGLPTPGSSDLNFAGKAAVSNLAFTGFGLRGEVSVRERGGSTYVVEDVIGYFVLPAVTATRGGR